MCACSEEVFDFSKNQITSARAKVLKDSMRADFDQIFQVCRRGPFIVRLLALSSNTLLHPQLCDFVLNNASRHSLLRVALETLSRFISWIPVAYVFETSVRAFALDCTTPLVTNCHVLTRL